MNNNCRYLSPFEQATSPTNMFLPGNPMRRFLFALSCTTVTLLTAGCGAGLYSFPPAAASPVGVQGSVHGGQQAINGASVQMYQAGSAGYGSGAVGLIANGGVLTDAAGNFNVDGKYTCQEGSQVYVVAIGGNSGTGKNPTTALMAGLGRCEDLGRDTFISVNEVTTVATIWALTPFVSAPTATPLTNETGAVDSAGLNIGAPPNNSNGLANAFADIRTLVDTTTGTAPGLVPTNAAVPVAAINSLADILAACVNSVGTGSGPCSSLFSLSRTLSGNTLSAALNIARNPGINVGPLLSLATATSPFQPHSPALTDLTLGIRYSAAGISSPSAIAVDKAANVWITNAGSNSITELSHTGTALSGKTGFLAGSLSSPAAVAIDSSGNVWVANAGNDSLTAFSPSGDLLPNVPFVGGGLSRPMALAFDSFGDLWVSNSGNDSVSQFTATGVPISPAQGFLSPGLVSPLGIVVSPF